MFVFLGLKVSFRVKPEEEDEEEEEKNAPLYWVGDRFSGHGKWYVLKGQESFSHVQTGLLWWFSNSV